jgi:putative glutamine amidotransferase
MRIELHTDRFYLSRHYSEAVEAAGGVPLHISLIPDQKYLESALAHLDGILLPGSDSDLDPVYYGREPDPALGQVHPIKDETDLKVIDIADDLGMPMLAICFGMQVLNVARGGTLIQDISAQMPEALKHEQGTPRDRKSHGLTLQEGSVLASLAACTATRVNSHHHQAIETLGRDLIGTAWSSDGLIEAFEDPRAERFVVGVQWHPELGWNQDAFSQALFNRFIERANGYSESRVQSEALRI